MIVGLNDYLAPATDGVHPMEHYRQCGYALPAVEASATFHAPLRAGDRIAIETTVTECGDASLVVSFSVSKRRDTEPDSDDGERAADGTVTFVLVDDDFEPTSLPEAVHNCVAERGDSLTE